VRAAPPYPRGAAPRLTSRRPGRRGRRPHLAARRRTSGLENLKQLSAARHRLISDLTEGGGSTLPYDGKREDLGRQVRKTPRCPRSWANSSLLYLYSHRNGRANSHRLGQPNTFLAAGAAARGLAPAGLETGSGFLQRLTQPRWHPAGRRPRALQLPLDRLS
jgi:hypothetical protein